MEALLDSKDLVKDEDLIATSGGGGGGGKGQDIKQAAELLGEMEGKCGGPLGRARRLIALRLLLAEKHVHPHCLTTRQVTYRKCG